MTSPPNPLSPPLSPRRAAATDDSPPSGRNPPSSAAPAETRSEAIIETDIPMRLDALPFGRFHILVIVALGITWILDGLEVTLAGALSAELMRPSALGLSNTQIGLAGSSYLAGAVLGAFFFGWPTGWGEKSCSPLRLRSTSWRPRRPACRGMREAMPCSGS